MWPDGTRLALPFSRGVCPRAGCRIVGLLSEQVGRQPRLAGLLSGYLFGGRAGRLCGPSSRGLLDLHAELVGCPICGSSLGGL
jgi:hypothetical protein